jgi:adenylate cyclase
LALFGLNTNPQTACRQALQAATLIATNIDELNQFLSRDLLNPIRFGIGIHGGEVIIGDIGYRDHQVFTAVCTENFVRVDDVMELPKLAG